MNNLSMFWSDVMQHTETEEKKKPIKWGDI